MGGKHHVEFANGSPVFFATDWAFGVSLQELLGGDRFGDAVGDFVSAETGFTFFAFYERISKSCSVTAGNPGTRIHDNGSVNTIDVVSSFDEVVPPGIH